MKKARAAEISVAAEVETLRSAVEAGRILVEQIRDGGLVDPDDEPRAQHGVVAILTLVDLRLDLLGKALHERKASSALRGRHNEPVDGAKDVVLPCEE